jgi:outer membrane protein insertion porin family
MATKQARFYRFFSSGDSYDPDQAGLRPAEAAPVLPDPGLCRFPRRVSAVAELTPDKRDFIITYVVEEGERYKFGDVLVESQIRDFSEDGLKAQLPMKSGDWYNAKQVEDTVEQLSETAGLLRLCLCRRPTATSTATAKRSPWASPSSWRNPPRVYVERIDINGNTLTQDKVVRREFRLNEGDAFNSFLVKRSENRINSLGYFQEKFEIEAEAGQRP